jgi:ABC-type uncharacterized transport system substrate-binding protein
MSAGGRMRRRDLIALGAGAVAWPLAAVADEPMPLIGVLHSATPAAFVTHMAAFRDGLKETGFLEGKNIAIVLRWAEGHYDRLLALATELVRQRPAVLVALGGDPSALAAKAATASIPIVFDLGGDPVKLGLVASLSRPGGNATGVSILGPSLEGKRLTMLHELVGPVRSVGVLFNPDFPPTRSQLADVREAARAMDVQTQDFPANTDREIEAAFETIARQHIPALLQLSDPFLNSRRAKIVHLAAERAIPTMYQFREYAAAGGLISYGPSLPDAYRQVGVYAGRILKGAKPADLPVIQPVKFELVVNLKTAKALKISVPDSILVRADEVME